MDILQSPRQNNLLAALSVSEFRRISPHLRLVHLKLGDVLHEPGKRSTYLYFPTTSIISLVYVLLDGGTAEISVVGREGVIGIAAFMGGGSTPNQAVVELAGDAYRLPGKIVKQEFFRARDLQNILLRYTQALLTQMGQTAICNRHHTVEQQLCRWLLLILDRLPSNEVSMTQELIAQMLGVRREGVTVAARKLRQDGLISYHRGCIIVNDRPGLEKRCCECYEVVRKEYDRLIRRLRNPV